MFSNKSHQPSITSKVVISKLRRNEFHLPHWFKTKLFHRKRPEMNVRLYTYKPENIETRQLCFPDSSGSSAPLLGFIWRAESLREMWGVVLLPFVSFLRPLAETRPQTEPGQNPEVERRPARLGEGGASLHRKEQNIKQNEKPNSLIHERRASS